VPAALVGEKRNVILGGAQRAFMKRNEVKQKNVMFGLDPDIQVVMKSIFDLDVRITLSE